MQPVRGSATRLRRATDIVMAAYLAGTGLLILIFRESVPAWPLLLAAHGAGAALLLLLDRVPERLPAAAGFVRDWYPLFLFPVLYKEVELLAAAFGNWGLTQLVYEWESVLFAGQPAVYLADSLPFLPLSEYLHACYFAYLALLPVIGGYWYFNGRRGAFHEMLLVVALIYAACFTFYILFPVDSPFYRVESPGEPLASGWAFQLVHFFAERGGARGGAFPSTHVAISTGIWLVCRRRDRRLAALLFFFVPGLYVATVYGRFHYALDVVAGWAVALVAFATLDRVLRARAGKQDRRPVAAQRA